MSDHPTGSGRTELVDPATEEVVGVLDHDSPAAVDAAVATAGAAYASWSRKTPAERCTLLLELADAVAAEAEELAEVESAEVGKPIAHARQELPGVVDSMFFVAGAARSLRDSGAGEYLAGSTSYIRREPLGVVGLITPWNYPLLQAAWKVGPALAAGNTAVLKPSELTPSTTLRLAELAAEILPPGVLELVIGDRTTGQALVSHPDIRLVSLTGDISTGKAVAASAAATLKRVHLELGGKAPVLVFQDAPIAVTAQAIAAAAMLNAGQDCTAACRVIVAASVHDELLEALTAAVEALRVGAPSAKDTEVGPLVSAPQLARVTGFVDRARDAGAKVTTGGHRVDGPGWFYAPTVLTGVSQTDEIVQSEVFGPVVTVQSAATEAEMLAMANDVDYGLSASVWTQDLARTMTLTRELTFGTVWVNQHLSTVSEMPFGGFGRSGYGKELSAYALEEYSQLKHVMIAPRP